MQLLKDEGAVPSPEDERRREEVIRELKKVIRGFRDACFPSRK
jgi:poly(A) polymerase